MADRESPLVARIEAAALWAWPPRETAYVEGWLLRAAGGHTRRVNSARTLAFAAGADPERAVQAVERWYGARGLPACFQLTGLAAPAGLDGALAARGYGRLPDVLVQTADLGAVAAAEDPPGVEVEGRATPLVMNGVCDPQWRSSERRARAELFGRIGKPHLFAVVTEGGQPAAGGLCVADGPLAGLFAVRTQAPFRGRGHARAVVRRLAAWARRQGAATLYLQVEEGNAPARALFASLGAATAYRYWYRESAA